MKLIQKMLKRNTKALSVVEYALMLSVVYLAIAGMNLYLKRGIQARVKDLTTNLIAKDLPLAEREHQFVAGNSASDYRVVTNNRMNIATSQDQRTGDTTTVVFPDENVTRRGTDYSVPEGWEDYLPASLGGG